MSIRQILHDLIDRKYTEKDENEILEIQNKMKYGIDQVILGNFSVCWYYDKNHALIELGTENSISKYNKYNLDKALDNIKDIYKNTGLTFYHKSFGTMGDYFNMRCLVIEWR